MRWQRALSSDRVFKRETWKTSVDCSEKGEDTSLSYRLVQRLQNDPEGELKALCRHCGIEFDPTMLSWDANHLPEYGVWASHWYDAILKSTGFVPATAQKPFRKLDLKVLHRCLPLYNKLRKDMNRDTGENLDPKDRDVLVYHRGGKVSSRDFAGFTDVENTVENLGGVYEVVLVEETEVVGLTDAIDNMFSSYQNEVGKAAGFDQSVVAQTVMDCIIANRLQENEAADIEQPNFCYVALVPAKKDDPETKANLVVVPTFTKPAAPVFQSGNKQHLTCADLLFTAKL